MDPSDPSDNLTFAMFGQCPSMLESNFVKPLLLIMSFCQSDNSLSDGKHACPMDPSDLSDNLTFAMFGQCPSMLESKCVKPLLLIMSFCQSDNSLSDGKYACPMDPSDLSDNVTFAMFGQCPSLLESNCLQSDFRHVRARAMLIHDRIELP